MRLLVVMLVLYLSTALSALSLASDFLYRYEGINQSAATKFFCLSNTEIIQINRTQRPHNQSSMVRVIINNLLTKELIAELFFEILPEKGKIELDLIRVTKDFRKQGLGTRLFNFIKACCKHYACKKIEGEFGFVPAESQRYTSIEDFAHAFEAAKHFYTKQKCHLTFSRTPTTYPTTSYFTFCWHMESE